MNTRTLEKGTIVKLNGFPVELQADVTVTQALVYEANESGIGAFIPPIPADVKRMTDDLEATERP